MTRYWKDLQVGEQFDTGSITLDTEDILEFAWAFDPQPYHLDAAAADDSIFGGLCASGWQVSAMMMRLLTDTFQDQDIAVMGVAGVPRMRWKVPVFAGDSLHARMEITACGAPPAGENLGTADLDVHVANEHGTPVIELSTRVFVAAGSLP